MRVGLLRREKMIAGPANLHTEVRRHIRSTSRRECYSGTDGAAA
jgi:hypothetical protein